MVHVGSMHHKSAGAPARDPGPWDHHKLSPIPSLWHRSPQSPLEKYHKVIQVVHSHPIKELKVASNLQEQQASEHYWPNLGNQDSQKAG